MDDTDPRANARSLHDTVAGTGPGIPDDALAPGEDALPEPPTDAEVAAAAKALGAPVPEAEEGGEPEAHPS
jgi:hypothetical protein